MQLEPEKRIKFCSFRKVGSFCGNVHRVSMLFDEGGAETKTNPIYYCCEEEKAVDDEPKHLFLI